MIGLAVAAGLSAAGVLALWLMFRRDNRAGRVGERSEVTRVFPPLPARPVITFTADQLADLARWDASVRDGRIVRTIRQQTDQPKDHS